MNATNELTDDQLRYWNLRTNERRMNARYAGQCRWCRGDVAPGQAVAFHTTTRSIRHTVMAECNGAVATRPARPATQRSASVRATRPAGRVCTNCGGRVPTYADHGLCNNCG